MNRTTFIMKNKIKKQTTAQNNPKTPDPKIPQKEKKQENDRKSLPQEQIENQNIEKHHDLEINHAKIFTPLDHFELSFFKITC